MDAVITAAARALAAGDVLGALKRVSLRDDPPALALRGIALAQLGELDRARALLRKASRAFGAREAVAQARCVTAEVEIALASRDLDRSAEPLAAAVKVLESRGDRINALYGRCLEIKRLLLLGRIGEAQRALSQLDVAGAPSMLVATAELLRVDVALRTLRTRAAREALARARAAAQRARLPALAAEIETAARALQTPAARSIAGGLVRPLLLEEVEGLLASPALVVDACRHVVRDARHQVPLTRRPVLFALARGLAEAWPQDVPREALSERAFSASRFNDSYRARLRVEMSRLRRALRPLAEVTPTARGFLLMPLQATSVVVLARPVDDAHGEVLALLADGESWSTSAVALALGVSQRTAQRALATLERSQRVKALGRGRARRWLAPPISGFATTLLLSVSLPFD